MTENEKPMPAILELSKLVEFFRENFGMSISESDFKKQPHMDRDLVHRMYKGLVMLITGTQEITLDMLPLNVEFANPELYSNAAPVMMLGCIVNNIILDISDDRLLFELSDLTRPDRKKTVRYISALVDFYQFSHQIKPQTDAMLARFKEKKEHRQITLAEIDDLKTKNEQKRRQNKGLEHSMSKKRETVQHLRKKFEQNQAKAQQQEDVNTEIESNLNSELAAIAELEDTYGKLQKESDNLSLKVVASPERFDKELKELQEIKASVHEDREIERKALEEMTERMETLVNNEQLLNELIDQLAAICLQHQSIDAHHKNVAALKANYNDLQCQYQQVKKSIAAKEEEFDSKIAQAEKHKRQNEAKMREIQKQIKNYKQKSEQIRGRCDQKEVVAADLENSIRTKQEQTLDIRRQFALHTDKFQRIAASFEQKVTKLENRLHSYYDKVMELSDETDKVVNEGLKGIV